MCENCNDRGWTGSGYLGDVDSRYCTSCATGLEVRGRMNGNLATLVTVGGRKLEITISQFEMSCLAQIYLLQRESNPNSRLIEVLCNAVRLGREYSDNSRVVLKVSCQCKVYETCDICRSSTEEDLRKLRIRLDTHQKTVDDGTENDPHERLS